MELTDLLRYVVGVLEKLSIPYLVTGSMATIAYGEPRFTNDVDIVIDLKSDQAVFFANLFQMRNFISTSQLFVMQSNGSDNSTLFSHLQV